MSKTRKIFISLMVFIFGILLCACSNNNAEIEKIESEIDELIDNDNMTSDEKMQNIFLINNEIAIFDDEQKNKITNYDELKEIEKQTIKNMVRNSKWKDYMQQDSETYYKFADILKDKYNSNGDAITKIECYDHLWSIESCRATEISQKDKLYNFFNNIPFCDGNNTKVEVPNNVEVFYIFDFVQSNEDYLDMRIEVWSDGTNSTCRIIDDGDITSYSSLTQCDITKLKEIIALPVLKEKEYYKFDDIMKDKFNCNVNTIERIEWYDDYFDSSPSSAVEGLEKETLYSFFDSIQYVESEDIKIPHYIGSVYQFYFVLNSEDYLNVRFNVWTDGENGICIIKFANQPNFVGLINGNMSQLAKLIAIPEE